MNHETVDKKDFDVASITRPGKAKRTNYIQDADYIEKARTSSSAKFIRVFSDIFLKREVVGAKSYF